MANSIDKLKKGYVFDEEKSSYQCLCCDKEFEEGEIYKIDDRFFEAKRAVEAHMSLEHKDYLYNLIHSDTKYNTLTDNQKNLMKLFAMNIEDKEIAKQAGISISTVRHQKFVFREKAKQAEQYLATYEAVFEENDRDSVIMMPVHEHARGIDERFIITEEERKRILETSFRSLEPLQLEIFPRKEKKKIVILARIAEEFKQGVEYNENQVNDILFNIFDDISTLRRYLIVYGFMKREDNGSKYWLS